MNEEEFEKIFNESLQRIINPSELEQVFDEISIKAQSFETFEEMQEYIIPKVKRMYNSDASNAWNILIKNLSKDFIKKYSGELVKLVDKKQYPRLLGVGEDGTIDTELLEATFLEVLKSIKEKNEYNFITENEHKEILQLLPEGFIKQHAIESFETFSSAIHKELIPLVFHELTTSDYEQVKQMINWLNENEETYVKSNLFKSIFTLLPDDFIKNNAELCFTVFSSESYKKIIEETFNDVTLNEKEQVKSLIGWLDENLIERLGNNEHVKKEVFENIVEVLPRELVRDNLEILVNGNSEYMIEKLYSKVFESKDGEEIEEEEIKKYIDLFLGKIETLNISKYLIPNEYIKIIDALPNKFIRQNLELCFEKFDKDAFPNVLAKYFTYDETEQIDEKNIKEDLKQVQDLIENKFDKSNFWDTVAINKCWETIVERLPRDFIKTEFNYIVTLLGENISDKLKKYFLQNLPEDLIKVNEDKLTINVNLDNIQEYKRYFEYLLTTNDRSILESDIGSKLFNFINYSNSSEANFLEMRELLESFKKTFQKPDMEKYSDYLVKDYSQELIPMDIEVFEYFIEDLENIKLHDGRIPEEYCDYIIKLKLSKDSVLNQNINKYLPILKRVFEDKVQHMLSKEGIEGYTIEFFKNDGNVLGYHNKSERIIGFLEDNLINLAENNSHIINTAYHEVRHAVQSKNYYSTDFSLLDGSRYNMIKEEIIRDDENTFYKRNYTRMYCEIDARLAGTRGQAEYLKYLGIQDEVVIENVGRTKVTLKDIVEKNQMKENENIEYASNKVDRDGSIVSISQKATELIKKNPKWIQTYPVLSLEFDENGERKKTPEILSSALSKEGFALRDIYLKIFGTEIQVSLEDAAETLNYVSKLLETREGYFEDTIELIDLIVKNEIIPSLRDVNIEESNCQIIFSMLNEIAKENPGLEISDYINETINKFLNDGKIEVEIKRDSELSNAAISTILNRDVKTKEEFEDVFRSLSKVMLKDEKTNWKLQFGFKNLFENYFKNDPTIDFNELLREALEFVPEDNRMRVMDFSWNAVPEELKISHLSGFIELCSQYRNIDSKFIMNTVSQIRENDFDENVGSIKEFVTKYIPQEVFHFLKIPKNNDELINAIKKAQSEGAEYEALKKVVDESVNKAITEKNPNSIEMIYTQVEFIEIERMRKNAITSFFILADDEVKKEYLEPLLKHLLLEKDYFGEEMIGELFDSLGTYVNERFFEENADLNVIINKIKDDALKKAKIRDEMLAEQKRLEEQERAEQKRLEEDERKRFKSKEDLSEKLSALKSDCSDEWNLLKRVEELIEYNMDGNSNVDLLVMLDASIKIFESKYRQSDMMKLFLNKIPNDKKAEYLKGFIETCSKYNSVDFKFADTIIDELNEQEYHKNPELLQSVFGEYLSPGLILCLKKPKTATEFKQIIKEAKEKNLEKEDIYDGLDYIIQKESREGNPESIEMLYSQIDFINEELDKDNAILMFYIYANDNLKIEYTEQILRHLLLEKDYFSANSIDNIIENVKSYMGENIFEENPDLTTIIDEIKENALEKVRIREEEKKRIKSEEDLIEKLNLLKSRCSNDFELVDEVKSLIGYNITNNLSIDSLVMLDLSIKLFEDKYRQNNIMDSFWEMIPNDKKTENLKGFLEICSRYKTIDFDFAYNIMEGFEEQGYNQNSEFLQNAFGEYLSPGLVLFLNNPKTVSELREILKEAEEKNIAQSDVCSGMKSIVNKNAAKGNMESIGMLYSQLEFVEGNYLKTNAITSFYIYASKEIKIQKTEEILRHSLIEKKYFDSNSILYLVDAVKRNIGKEILTENPTLSEGIDKIKTEAIENQRRTDINFEIQEPVTNESILLERNNKSEQNIDTQNEQLLALQKIRNDVPAADISMGKKMIKAFLAKAKGITNKIGKFFGGGDNHEDR